MKNEELKPLLQEGESERLEFKTSLKLLDKIGETISAFSNSAGGIILIGLSDEGSVLGVTIGANTLEELANYIKRNTDPSIYPSIMVERMGDKQIVLIEVAVQNEKPVFFKGHAHKRVGKTSLELTSSEIRKMAKESGEKVYWDEKPCTGATLEDIDKEKVDSFLGKRKEIRKTTPPTEMDFNTLLLNIKAAKMVDGRICPTNAGILFFGKNPQRFILQSQLRLARFAGNKPTRDFLDRLDCHGALWAMLEQAENFIKANMKLLGFRTEFAFKRIDKFEYPLRAIREGIVNALIHRDYEGHSDTMVMIFDDRIEILNPGAFPKGTSPNKPRHVPVNPVLCQLMYDIGVVEKYGTGIYLMKELCKEYGLANPIYKVNKHETRLIFKSGGKAVVLSEIGTKLNERQKNAFKYVLSKGFITNRDYIKLNNVSNKTANHDLKVMVKYGLLSIYGKGRSVRYLTTQ